MEMKFSVSLISLFVLLSAYAAEGQIFDVTTFGAKPNGEISQALLSAWKEACASPSPSSIVIPKGTYMSNEVTFAGPCKAPVQIKFAGIIQANADPSSFKTDGWFVFEHIEGFSLVGGGTFDGQGAKTWAKGACHERPDCAKLPYNLRFNFITNGLVQDITTLNSKNFHTNVLGCKNITFERYTVTAPGDSPNTDGIHVGRSSSVYILDSVIKTGDDCISIGDGSQEVHVERVTCGPGHGISIGSLGKYPDEEPVSGIFVKNCTLVDTSNGVRIKSWPASPGHTTASNMHFEDIVVINAGNPVIIDQEYCPWSQCKTEDPSKVKISNVSFKNIKGTSSTVEAMKLVCSKSSPCENVEIGDIDLAYHGPEGAANTTCSNIQPKFTGKVNLPTAACGASA